MAISLSQRALPAAQAQLFAGTSANSPPVIPLCQAVKQPASSRRQNDGFRAQCDRGAALQGRQKVCGGGVYYLGPNKSPAEENLAIAISRQTKKCPHIPSVSQPSRDRQAAPALPGPPVEAPARAFPPACAAPRTPAGRDWKAWAPHLGGRLSPCRLANQTGLWTVDLGWQCQQACLRAQPHDETPPPRQNPMWEGKTAGKRVRTDGGLSRNCLAGWKCFQIELLKW
ncbi:hypothetical protein B0T25DRAFT_239522 [Lasiosphaeria hispida]|uniref:Uncharacterized protein n=1 Tax=Lasiosphaeria hispida TaxID=260671 RepID=A0AAJ0HF08_9PEZI|nr:hypothetical protein B0T25DRAFT_239522 [Lasiosphaeria hispida]